MNLLFIGYFAVFFTVVSFLPQAIKTLKTREVNGLSALTYLFLFLGSLSWFSYGLVLSDIPLVVTNFLTTFFIGVTFFLIVEENSKIN